VLQGLCLSWEALNLLSSPSHVDDGDGARAAEAALARLDEFAAQVQAGLAAAAPALAGGGAGGSGGSGSGGRVVPPGAWRGKPLHYPEQGGGMGLAPSTYAARWVVR
jgi:hypothetical protein